MTSPVSSASATAACLHGVYRPQARIRDDVLPPRFRWRVPTFQSPGGAAAGV
ncbi:hypothetical protein [Nocardiopsis sp. RV163]|uniref:hypothetical protein n=1 Tax=Nocardiopsis sp. RV163 TaxID=1661388 RepID=UPI001F35951C|nr:hypothetical protein [Nocardiopsis sp. RV163]